MRWLPDAMYPADVYADLAVRFYALPAEMPAELAFNRGALVLCAAVDALAWVALPAFALLALLAAVRRARAPLLVFRAAAAKAGGAGAEAAEAPPRLPAQRSFAAVGRALTRGGAGLRSAEKPAVPRIDAGAETFDDAVARSANRGRPLANSRQTAVEDATPPAVSGRSSAKAPSGARALFTKGLSQRVDIFDPSSPVYDSPVILPVRPAYLSAASSASKPAPTASVRAAPPAPEPTASSDDLLDGVARDLDALLRPRSLSPAQRVEPLAGPYPVTTTPLPAVPAGEPSRPPPEARQETLVERWSEMSISAPRAAEAEARGSEGPASPSKFEELLSEIDKLTLESEAVARELPVREENRLKVVVEEVKVGQDARDGQVEGDERDRSGNQILDELLQDGAASTENAENAESTESTARPVTPSGPAVPSSRLPLRIPTSTGKSPVPPAADAETGFPGLWYRLPNRAAASTHSPTEHTPRSLRLPARVPVREGSPTEKTPLSGQTSSSAGTLAAGRSPEAERHFTPPSYPRPDYSKIPSHYAHTRPGGKPVTGTPADRLRDAAASAAGSAERPLYYVRSTLPSNQNRVNDLFASVLRSESPAGRS